LPALSNPFVENERRMSRGAASRVSARLVRHDGVSRTMNAGEHDVDERVPREVSLQRVIRELAVGYVEQFSPVSLLRRYSYKHAPRSIVRL
jgi:hypothetical protein